jgi:hypothetical protein
MSERGPIYDIELLKSLPLDGGFMRQALPNRHDLELTRRHNDRVAAGFEVLTEHYRRAIAEIERLRAECQTQPCGHAARWLAYENPVDAGSERYCVFCEVARLRGENDWLAEQLDDATAVSTRLRDELASVRQHEAGMVEAVRLQEAERKNERLRLGLAAAEACATYWHHDANCNGGCCECSRLASEMEVAERRLRLTEDGQ